jgi:hypothetical protein
MKEGLAALTKFVKVVMAYRPDRKNQTKPPKKRVGTMHKPGHEKTNIQAR